VRLPFLEQSFSEGQVFPEGKREGLAANVKYYHKQPGCFRCSAALESEAADEMPSRRPRERLQIQMADRRA